MKRLDQEAAAQELAAYFDRHFDPRADAIWQIIEKHATPPNPDYPNDNDPEDRIRP